MRIILTLLTLVFLTGCGRVSEEARNEILEKDPSFVRVYREKERLTGKISELEENFKNKTIETRRQIASLKENLKKEKAELDSRTLSLRDEIAPHIKALEGELEVSAKEYDIKRRDLRECRRKLKTITDFLSKKQELPLTGEEISAWDKRARKLEKEIVSITKELDALRNKIHVTKTEIRILKE